MTKPHPGRVNLTHVFLPSNALISQEPARVSTAPFRVRYRVVRKPNGDHDWFRCGCLDCEDVREEMDR